MRGQPASAPRNVSSVFSPIAPVVPDLVQLAHPEVISAGARNAQRLPERFTVKCNFPGLDEMKPSPNMPCPCGSGRKYKKCHGSQAAASASANASGASVADWLASGARMEAAKQWQQAELHYQQALKLDPGSQSAWIAIGRLAERFGDEETAQQCFEQLVALAPDNAPGHFSLGNIHAKKYDFEAAGQAYRRALELDPSLAGAWCNLGNVEKYLGQFADAQRSYRRAISSTTEPAQRAKQHSNLLLSLHYDGSLSHAAVYQEHRDWADQHARALYPASPSWPNHLDADRRLNIGYVSGGFYESPILAYFLSNVLAHHDKSGFFITAYSSSRAPENPVAALRKNADAWVDIAHLDDDAAAEKIRRDVIDILIDLDGHGPTGRPLIFARKPAPLQVEWLDWFNTSGMDTIDYFLTDPYTTPPDSPQRFSEQPIPLPHCRLCYSPVGSAPPVAPMPALTGAPFTYGSFNRQDKFSPEVLRGWAGILHAVPDSRLLLKNRALQITAVKAWVEKNFARLGIPAERLVLRGPSTHVDMLKQYGDVDVALDTFPYNGGLTTCECLWMGVPIVAIEAERVIGRQTSAMLRLLGLDEWVASSTDDYVRLAVEKSRQQEAVAALRGSLRQRFEQSPLCDAPRFARDLERVYRSMWQRYCAVAGGSS